MASLMEDVLLPRVLRESVNLWPCIIHATCSPRRPFDGVEVGLTA